MGLLWDEPAVRMLLSGPQGDVGIPFVKYF